MSRAVKDNKNSAYQNLSQNDIPSNLSSSYVPLKRSRWDIQVEDAICDTFSKEPPHVSSELSSSHDSGEKEESCVMPVDTTDYECFLPLDTPLLKTELLGRLQLALWSSKCHHSLTLKRLESEQRNVSHLKFLFYTLLMLIVKKKIFQSTAFLENLRYLEIAHFRLSPKEHDTSQSISLTSNDESQPSATQHSPNVLDPSIQISKLLFQFLHFLEKQLCEELFQSKERPSSQSTINQELEAFLDQLSVLHGTQQDSMALDSSHDSLDVSIVERNRLIILLHDLQKQRDSLELLVDQCRKQISIYLSRDPLTPELISRSKLFNNNELCIKAPEIFISFIPNVVRSLKHLHAQNKQQLIKLHRCEELISKLKKDVCDREVDLHALHRHHSNQSPKDYSSESDIMGKAEQLNLLEKQEKLLQEKSHLLELTKQQLTLSCKRNSEVFKPLKERCIAAETQAGIYLKEKQSSSFQCIQLQGELEALKNRVSLLENEKVTVLEEKEKELKRIFSLLQTLKDQRQVFMHSPNSLEHTDESRETPTQRNVTLQSLLRQRDHLATELDELSAVLETNYTTISQLEDRYNERNERFLALMQEDATSQNEKVALQTQVKHLSEQVENQQKQIDQLTDILDNETKGSKSYTAIQDKISDIFKQTETLHKYEKEIVDKSKQILLHEKDMKRIQEKYAVLQHSNLFLLKKLKI
ncbi:thyroid receptor-interacting protein 11-like isoform X2 [Hylaeus volcanicus]|uniref:thyroid receptor-interacting protein 11-like isoform X2 n=1 Tax=Hylaeus volcanicus TaxID=313075 RepID=UPI0023B82A2D|nr:thyroid receptor-interacting protein 11-like isoform X2 [Hylaeus volcanicus]